MNIIKAEVIKSLSGAVNLSGDEISALLEKPADKTKGDYALACFRLSKAMNKTPNQIAFDIADKIKPTELISDIKVIGAYVNFFANTDKLKELTLSQILSHKDDYGKSDIGKGKTVVIEYSSPNIAKPMGIGHLRSTVIGNAIYKIYKKLGYNCVGINYLGDWGTQFGMLIADYNENPYPEMLSAGKDLPTTFLTERYVTYNEKSKTNPALLDNARQEFRKLEEGETENTKLWDVFRALSISEFKRIYEILGVVFDEYSGESITRKSIGSAIDEIEKKGLSEISDGALIVNLDKYGMIPCLLRKGDGATLYASRDIAEAIRRQDKYKFSRMIYVVGSDQKLHFKQFFKVLELMGKEWAKDCLHVDFGLVRIEGEKMSTRKGKSVLLEDVLKEAIERSKSIMRTRAPDVANKVAEDKIESVAKAVGIGAIIFNDLKNKRTRDIDFKWEQVVSFDGETGPYLQYTHTRLASLLEKAKEAGYKDISFSDINIDLLKEEDELLLVKKLYDYPEIIGESAGECEPSIISNYLLDLASTFNRFYRYHRIISSDNNEKELSKARIALVKSLKYVLAGGLELLGIKALEEM
jgi:arginyl-tRNA synthetase